MALAGLAVGLGAAPLLGPDSSRAPGVLVLAAVAAMGVCGMRPAGPRASSAGLAALAAVAAVAGLGLGALRVAAIDAGALQGPPGAAVEVTGAVSSVPRIDQEGLSFGLDAGQGRVLVRTHGSVEDFVVGSLQRVRGRLSEPEPWRAAQLERRGIALELDADRVEPAGGARGGLEGRIDAIRERAERGLARGVPEREAALSQGFVLGEDDRIDPLTRQDFRRSGLTHLLAVSGQNILLLCLLAWPFLALLGLTLRARLIVLLALIAVYVPVTGAGPSIQRAAAMGAAGLVAALADRPRSRWYALLLAADLTLALNPRAAGDIGWQLSFAAVVGILLWSTRLASALAGGAERATPRRALADGVAVTASATLATAPLMAHHFDSLSLAALPANLLALPAVAPAMWLGMLSAGASQLPIVPVEPFNWVGSLCLAYIAQVARLMAAPRWALLELGLGGPVQVAVAYAVLLGFVELCLLALRRHTGRSPRPLASWPGGRRLVVLLAAVAGGAVLWAGGAWGSGERPAPPPGALVVRVLDVGQGDAILLDPPGGAPVLVDSGPPGAGLAGRLRDLGARSLGALVLTHADSDHSGGEAEVLETAAVGRVCFARAAPAVLGPARAAGVRTDRLVEGGEIRSGELRLTALWPPRELAETGSGMEANGLSVVLLAEWLHFSMLLTGDGEAEAVPLDPGPVDVLKLAHHGSADQGLAGLLERTAPRLAVISVGESNPFGHPSPQALAALGEHHVPWLRTDEAGEIEIVADAAGWRVRSK